MIEAAHRVLIIGPSWVGDMVMTQPLCARLQQQYPGAVIDLLAPAWSFPIVARMPHVSEVIESPFSHGSLSWRARRDFGRSLKERCYDQAILIPNSWKSALVPWWASIPVRTGWVGEQRWGLLNDIRPLDKQRYSRMIERVVALGYAKGAVLPESLPNPVLTVSDPEAALIRLELVYDDRPLLIICPGAEFGQAKRWTEAHYAAVANDRLRQGWRVWLSGSPKDQPVTQSIMQLTNHGCVDLAGRDTLGEAVDLLSLATCVLTNDSGLMHVAAAVGVPLVAVFGPTSSHYTPPLSDRCRVLSLSLDCQPCFQRTCPLQHHHCMEQLLPGQVLEAIDSVVGA